MKLLIWFMFNYGLQIVTMMDAMKIDGLKLSHVGDAVALARALWVFPAAEPDDGETRVRNFTHTY